MAAHHNAQYNVNVYWADWVEDADGNMLYHGFGWSECGRWYTSKAGVRYDATEEAPMFCNVRVGGGRQCCGNHWSRDCRHGVNPHRQARLDRARRAAAVAAAPAGAPALEDVLRNLALNNNVEGEEAAPEGEKDEGGEEAGLKLVHFAGTPESFWS